MTEKFTCSPPNIKVIKGSNMKVVGHIACREEIGKEYNMVVERYEGRVGNQDVSGRLLDAQIGCKVVGWIQLNQDEVK
jgi:hypothetical protein